MKQVILLLAVSLGLASCTKEEYVMEHNAYVDIMTDNSVKVSTISSCTGLDTSITVDFGVAICINIATLPEVNDIRFDAYEFYAIVNGVKVIGMDGIKSQIGSRLQDMIEGEISMQISGHTELTIYLLEENYRDAEFFVKANGIVTKINLNQIY